MSLSFAPPERVGFVGLGMMGVPMARNLARAGYPLAVIDSNAEAVKRFVAEVPAATPASRKALGEMCRVVITMLPDGKIVRDVLLDAADNVAAGMQRGSCIIDMSSSSPVGTRDLGPLLAKHGLGFIDAPVSGGVKKAIEGTLAIMIGGDAAVADRCEPVLLAMGKQLFRTGPLGSGHAMKALNNYVSAAGFLAAAEAVLAGDRFGIAPATAIAVLNASTGKNNSTENKYTQQVLNRAFAGGFSMALMVKDLQTALEVAQSSGMPTPLADVTVAVWAHAQALLGGAVDHTAVAQYVEHLAGSEIGAGPKKA